MLVLGCTFKYFPIHKEIETSDFWMFVLQDLLIFPNS